MAKLYNLHVTVTKRVNGRLHKQSGTIVNGVIKTAPLTPVEEEYRISDISMDAIEADYAEHCMPSAVQADRADAKDSPLLLEHFDQHQIHRFLKRAKEDWELLMERLFASVEYKLASDC
jgi:hypothetical protein